MPKRHSARLAIALSAVFAAASPLADDAKGLFTTHGNAEMPNVLYITPWRAPTAQFRTQQLTLHSLYGDLFEPIEPNAFEAFVRARDAAGKAASDALAKHR